MPPAAVLDDNPLFHAAELLESCIRGLPNTARDAGAGVSSPSSLRATYSKAGTHDGSPMRPRARSALQRSYPKVAQALDQRRHGVPSAEPLEPLRSPSPRPWMLRARYITIFTNKRKLFYPSTSCETIQGWQPTQKVPESEWQWLRALGILNEAQARVFVAQRAMECRFSPDWDPAFAEPFCQCRFQIGPLRRPSGPSEDCT